MGAPLLLVAAFPPELAPLRGALGPELRRPFGGHDVVAKAVGIGLPTAAAGAAERLATLAPRAVVMVGTCGAYEGALAVDGVAVARRIALVDGGALAGDAAFPDPMSTELSADPGMSGALATHGATLADVATTLAITTSDALAGTIASQTRCQVEHLEAYGVAAACAAAGVPFTAVLGVANAVGSRGRAEWKAHHRSASEAAVRVVLAWIAAGALGSPR